MKERLNIFLFPNITTVRREVCVLAFSGPKILYGREEIEKKGL